MPIILSLETSGTAGSVAVIRDAVCLGQVSLHLANSHAETLGQNIDHLLKMVGVAKSELSAIALSAGPGSFTGLRIGTSTAKGLCFGLEIPLIPVETHKALAYAILEFVADGDLIIPMQDARRMEVYATVYQRIGSELSVCSETTNYILDEHSFGSERNGHKVWFIGDGVSKFSALIDEPRHQYLAEQWPTAESVGKIAHQYLLNNERMIFDTAYYTPFYLKPWVGNQTTPKK